MSENFRFIKLDYRSSTPRVKQIFLIHSKNLNILMQEKYYKNYYELDTQNDNQNLNNYN